jgi:hypothetical protein
MMVATVTLADNTSVLLLDQMFSLEVQGSSCPLTEHPPPSQLDPEDLFGILQLPPSQLQLLVHVVRTHPPPSQLHLEVHAGISQFPPLHLQL